MRGEAYTSLFLMSVMLVWSWVEIFREECLAGKNPVYFSKEVVLCSQWSVAF